MHAKDIANKMTNKKASISAGLFTRCQTWEVARNLTGNHKIQWAQKGYWGHQGGLKKMGCTCTGKLPKRWILCPLCFHPHVDPSAEGRPTGLSISQEDIEQTLKVRLENRRVKPGHQRLHAMGETDFRENFRHVIKQVQKTIKIIIINL